jgi:Mg-chelatase subunit ChlD
MNRRLLPSILIAGALCAPQLRAWESLSESLDMACTQGSPARLDCSYRLLDGGDATDITARAGGTSLPVTARSAYPGETARTAVLIVVDTSDPGRQPVIDKNVAQIQTLLSAARSHHQFGLGTFDRQLRELVPIGSPPAALRQAAASLRAVGMTTELYRSLLQAVETLAKAPADRRALVVFSDGQPEDRAYFHSDVVRAARRSGVVINTLGFPRSVALSVSLQTLRRLSEETGGVYLDTDMSFDLPADFAARIFSNIDAGGRMTIDAGKAAAQEIVVEFRTSRGTLTATVPSASAPAVSAPAPAAPVPSAQRAAPEIRVITTAAERDALDTWLWYGIPAALIVLIILTGVTLVLIYRKPAGRAAPAAAAAASEVKPFAYLIAQDEKATRHPIRSTIWRIGRSHDNELVLDDNSISRRHAEIQRGADGTFVLIDKDSLNGVFVNGEKIGRRELREGDVLEIGDVFLRFTEAPADDQLIERTSMQHTRAPRVA